MSPTKSLIITLIALLVVGCGGGASTPTVPQTQAYVTSKQVSGNDVIYSYSDGSTITKTIASTSSAQWASNHTTKTITYSFTDGTTDSISEEVNPTISNSFSGENKSAEGFVFFCNRKTEAVRITGCFSHADRPTYLILPHDHVSARSLAVCSVLYCSFIFSLIAFV